ncbi:unnamed protein product [[Actinomadura] parvosata subsp. kistnae]|uniref:Small secreted hydrophilic protein n=1 Tax=[Actinomadura] parvosata subsp. kistnae TaxID=1909395 RepID=A0A1V0A844_9ACTN|nr:hypothetical protein BKM31_37420 [Nonomuraea sp. ATCC 55076]SPL95584.1 unnamed protein product [Actinomadura parvosata subsp. kistnae]
MILLALVAAAAGVMTVGLVRAADEELDLGGPVVVSPSSGRGSAARPVRGDDGSAPEQPGRAGDTGEAEPVSSAKASPEAGPEPSKSEEPARAERPAPRKTKAEPVKPPSPRPGGGDDGDDDDDGDDGGGDDGDD